MILFIMAYWCGTCVPEARHLWAGLGGAIVAFAGLWILPALVYAGLAVLIASNVWDFWNGRRTPRHLRASFVEET